MGPFRGLSGTLADRPRAEVRCHDDAAGIARAAADLVLATARAALAEHGRCAIALAGGSTPRALYRLLAVPPWRDAMPWADILWFWGDERHVPPDHPDSNFRMAHDALLSQVPVPAANVFRIEAEDPDPAAAAVRYEARIRDALGLGPKVFPTFDLVLLGIGADGHTASLFPGTVALRETRRIVVANRVPQLDTDRITLTAPAINHAARVVFLVAGADKAPALAAVLEGPRDPDRLPSQLVAPDSGPALWLVDHAAAAQLKGS
jgi:6-phosphogluconolactonase